MKRENLGLFTDKNSICPLSINLDVLLKNRYAKERYNRYKTLQVVYNNYMATYDELVALDNKLKTHQRHLQFLATEIYKSKNKLNPIFMWNRRNISHIHGEGVLPS